MRRMSSHDHYRFHAAEGEVLDPDRLPAKLRLLRRRSWPATVAGPLTPTAPICAGSLPGPPRWAWRCSKRPGLISSCIAVGSKNRVWRRRRLTGACPLCAASTVSPTSTGGSRRTRPNTFAAPTFTRPRAGGWTAANSERSCSPRSATTMTTRLWRCCSA